VVKLGALVVLFFAIWFALLNDSIIKMEEPYYTIVKTSPLYLLVVFGCYSLAIIAYHMIIIRDCVEEARSLEKERNDAIAFFKTKGIIIDSRKM